MLTEAELDPGAASHPARRAVLPGMLRGGRCAVPAGIPAGRDDLVHPVINNIMKNVNGKVIMYKKVKLIMYKY